MSAGVMSTSGGSFDGAEHGASDAVTEGRAPLPAVVDAVRAPLSPLQRAVTTGVAFLVAVLLAVAVVLAAASAAVVGVLLAMGALATRLFPRRAGVQGGGPNGRAAEGWTFETARRHG